MKQQLILASGSPRRQQMLSSLGLKFEVCPMNVDESVRAGERAADYVERLAREKAQQAMQVVNADSPVILAADTTVEVGGTLLGKPESRQDAHRMLGLLSGTVHRVLTGVAVLSASREDVICVETRVTFRDLQPAEIDYYWETGEPKDKAGSYGLQGIGAAFVSVIDGSYSNVIGLPLVETIALVRSHGIQVLGTGDESNEQLLIQDGRHG